MAVITETKKYLPMHGKKQMEYGLSKQMLLTYLITERFILMDNE